MCGVLGLYTPNSAICMTRFAEMRDAISHRGPDDHGVWTNRDGTLALGHRRLAVIDLSPAGHQPMETDDGAIVLVFNGEIYNFRDLREELAGKGHRFRGHSDTEVLLRGYQQWGLDVIERLHGMFALAIYDGNSRCLHLARDRAGEKPLFYYRDGNRFAFASELKALLTDPDMPRSLNWEAFEHYLAYGYVPREKCLLNNYAKLPAGHVLTFDLTSQDIRTSPYWSLPRYAPNGRGEAELIEELHGLLLDSVKRQLVADVPVGVLLSGGLDSSLVTAAAAHSSSGTVRTFNIAFPGHGRYDESAHARQVASYLGTDHVEMAAEPGSVDLLPKLAAQYDEPIADNSIVPTFIVSQLIRQEATVALSGDGGDELFGGYRHYNWVCQREPIRQKIPRQVRRVLEAAARQLPLGVPGRNYLLGLTSPYDTLAQSNILFDEQSRLRLAPALRNGYGGLGPEEFKVSLVEERDSVLQRATGADFLTYMCDDILVKVDRASMLNSLEVRAPLLDGRIIEFAFRDVPDQMKATLSDRKVVLRHLAKRLLPPDFDSSRKQGFSIPLSAWFKKGWGSTMVEILSDSDPNLFDRREIDRLIAGQRRGLKLGARLLLITMFELWRKTYSIDTI